MMGQKYLSQNSNRQQIQAFLKSSCLLVPTAIKPECQQFAVDYNLAIENYIIFAKTSVKMCNNVGVCPDAKWNRLIQAKPDEKAVGPPLMLAILFDQTTKSMYVTGGFDPKVVGYPAIFKTPNKGKSWQVVYNGTSGQDLRALVRMGDGSFVAISGSQLLRSKDGQTFYLDQRTFQNLDMSTMFVNGTTFIAQSGGTVLRSRDNLATIETINLGLPQIKNMRSMGYSNGAIFLGVGLDYGSSRYESRILKSTDGGSTFKTVFQASGSNPQYTSVQGIMDAGNGVVLATSERKILRSSNNGESFAPVFDITGLNSTITITRTFALAKNGTIYTAFDSSSSTTNPQNPDFNNNSQIWYSEDNGLTWQFHSRLMTKRCFKLVFDENEQNFFAGTGEKGEVWGYI